MKEIVTIFYTLPSTAEANPKRGNVRLQLPRNWHFKSTDFVDTTILNVLQD